MRTCSKLMKMPRARCARLLISVLDTYQFGLPNDPKLALMKLSAHINSMETKDREYPPCPHKKVLPLGYWQSADWVYGLLKMGAEAERVAGQLGSST